LQRIHNRAQVIGREREITRVCEILARRRKNNPILLGEPGVGKTAIAEGLAVAVAVDGQLNGRPLPSILQVCALDAAMTHIGARALPQRNASLACTQQHAQRTCLLTARLILPVHLLLACCSTEVRCNGLQGVRILQLDVGLLVAGAKERGELESRVTDLISSLEQAAGSTILVIDEIHTLVGAGAVGRGGVVGAGGLDIGNLLKPALTGRLQVVGATTRGEFVRRFERDMALVRRFQPVTVEEPTPDEALEVCGAACTCACLLASVHVARTFRCLESSTFCKMSKAPIAAQMKAMVTLWHPISAHCATRAQSCGALRAERLRLWSARCFGAHQAEEE
jgi:AAA ATPase domain